MPHGLLVATLTLALVVPGAPPPTPSPGERRVNELGMAFAWCPPGRFIPLEETAAFEQRPRPEVRIEQGFLLGITEVTQRQYAAVMGETTTPGAGDDTPADDMSWLDAVEFCRRLTNDYPDGYRLPSAAEWEYACRAGSSGQRYGPLDEVAWYRKDFDAFSPSDHPFAVGLLAPNAWGLHDMLGNLWELCQDRSYESDEGYPEDGSARELTVWPEDMTETAARHGFDRIIRGGSFIDWSPEMLTAGYRAGVPGGMNCQYVGFRVVLVPGKGRNLKGDGGSPPVPRQPLPAHDPVWRQR